MIINSLGVSHWLYHLPFKWYGCKLLKYVNLVEFFPEKMILWFSITFVFLSLMMFRVGGLWNKCQYNESFPIPSFTSLNLLRSESFLSWMEFSSLLHNKTHRYSQGKNTGSGISRTEVKNSLSRKSVLLVNLLCCLARVALVQG